jgi:hypothetical protein
MTQLPPSSHIPRPGRVKLAGAVLALVQLENGRQVRARMHQLSSNGGVLSLSDPLDEAGNVKLLFHVGSTTVHGKAEMMYPMWATRGCLQAFRFTDVPEEERKRLSSDLQFFLQGFVENPTEADRLAADAATEFDS